MTTPILDEPILPPARTPLVRRIFIGLEIALLFFVLVALLWKSESWEGGSEMLVIGFSCLSLLYLVFPILLFGSRGWKQHLGSHAVGFAMMFGVWGMLFTLESWQSGTEMVILGLMSTAILAITTTVLWMARRSQPDGGRFYRNAALRLIPCLVILLFFIL